MKIIKKKLKELVNFKYGKMPMKRKISEKGKFPVFSGYRVNGYYDEYNVEKNEIIVIARGVGGTGDVKIIREKSYLTNLAIRIINDETAVLNKYLYYYFLKNNLKYLDSGSAQSQITIADLENVHIEIPSLKLQESIINILEKLDKKIELNNEINNNLLFYIIIVILQVLCWIYLFPLIKALEVLFF
ncbi:hypothetical protein IX317_000257 [Fusobacterium sp. DD29]|uniref:restriction endonuclease subunit S n=1 Tax=unclassified Fusobacterium TaxID=2648384 RepID=UPI001B8D5619|nr:MULTISPECIES: restriction endonuclease subunit S [unclassified Fusobacterium]MBR8748598.1 hypothetical protein [Fusobacterium sp. DD29]MBR8760865.1 hypothetical protein [Fusobacterium sp. DD25]MBR8766877.1 hypothetical protein [Fusobacterium sp. DD43]MBR8770878.1 hypothetical protein [Fusobacterium sp. DD40]MBR8775108.1 hypothetical protein [Fusobacterium sp. DD17]